jgi:hypothetical protein
MDDEPTPAAVRRPSLFELSRLPETGGRGRRAGECENASHPVNADEDGKRDQAGAGKIRRGGKNSARRKKKRG